MAKIDRKAQKIFGGNSAQNGQFGSARAGTKILSNDPDVLQALPAWGQGWAEATVSGDNLPTMEEDQGINFVLSRQVAYILQQGIPEYNEDTVYYENSLVMEEGTVKLYKSLTDDNEGNPLSDAGEWAFLVDFDDVSGLPLNNYSATTDPTVNDDSGDGYSPGSIWYNSTGTGEAFLCVDATLGAAKWIKTTLTVDELGSAAFQPTSAFTSAAEGLAILALYKGRPTKGLKLSNNGADSTNDIDIAAGTAVSDDGTTIISGPAYTKRLDAAFAAGNNQGFLSTGSIANTTYHIWAICKNGGADPDYIADVSATSPTMPASYTKKCRIGSIIRQSGSILQFVQTGNRFMLKSPVLDVNTTFGASASNTAVSLPSGIKVLGLFNIYATKTTSSVGIYLADPDAGGLVPVSAAAPLSTMFMWGNTSGSGNNGIQAECFSNTSSQIAIAAESASTTIRVVTIGWEDRLGQN